MRWTAIGHSEQKGYFTSLMERDALGHAYLLEGPEGVGKHMVARDLAAALLGGTIPPDASPDAVLLAPGVSETTGKPTDIPVETVREMKVWAYQRPLYGAAKVVIIDDADRLSDAAADTILKVLEEPPPYLYFLLVTALPGSVLPTIRSRCEAVPFRTLAPAEMTRALAHLNLDADDRALVSAVAAGRPGTAVRLVDDGELSSVARCIADFERALKTGTAERMLFAARQAEDDDVSRHVRWWVAWVHAKLPEHPGLAPVAHGLLELDSAVTEPKYNRRLALERFVLSLP